MTAETQSAPVTIVFTDIVNSTQLLQRLGDERAQRVFDGHHHVLRDAILANGGDEVKWEGDGVMAAFASTAAAVRCAISMQEGVRRPVDGELIEMRVGLNVGEAFQEDGDYFGTTVVIAQRLCSQADQGQILCSSLVAGLLSGRQAFKFEELGSRELKGISQPVAVCEVRFERANGNGMRAQRLPFVGREEEVTRLNARLDGTVNGQGGLVLLAGEPGIGKTRITEEFVQRARGHGAVGLWGRCYEGDWAPPYSPFAEVIREYATDVDVDELRTDLGVGAAPIARLVPSLREQLPDIPEPEALQADEERFRLLDAVSQFLIAAAVRTPMVIVLEDLHWADRGTVDLLRHVSRFAPQHHLLVVGTYRDAEVDSEHPLSDVLGALHREPAFEQIDLKGLDTSEVGQLISALGEQEARDDITDVVGAQTNGNPFYIGEVLRHMVETGLQQDGRWTNDAASIQDIGVPESVRKVIGGRIAHLSDDGQRLLTAAALFDREFPFAVVASVAKMDEAGALDAIDEALDGQLLKPGLEPDTLDFTHALIRDTLCSELSPPRRVRLHRQVAEALEAVYADEVDDHVAELAYQYHRSAALPGGDRGAGYALAAADQAEAAYAHEDVAMFLRMTLDLISVDDDRRPRVLARMGLALAWAMQFEDASKAAIEAGELLAGAEGPDAAADYLLEAALAVTNAGSPVHGPDIARAGLQYAKDRRDLTWVWLSQLDLDARDRENPDYRGITSDTPEHREVARVARGLSGADRDRLPGNFLRFSSRDEVLNERTANRATAFAEFSENPYTLTFFAGEFEQAVVLFRDDAAEREQRGQLATAVRSWTYAAICENALGNFSEAQSAFKKAMALAARLPEGVDQGQMPMVYLDDRLLSFDQGWGRTIKLIEPILNRPDQTSGFAFAFAGLRSAAARMYARVGQEDEALRWLESVLDAIDEAPAWADNYPRTACDAAVTLWWLDRTDHIELIERNIREKIIEPDFRYPMKDGRLAMAQLSALQGRYDEAAEWFAKARSVLDEQGARPLRTIVDFDEALMFQRRGAAGDSERVVSLLDTALVQFRELEMKGWTDRANALRDADRMPDISPAKS